MKALKTSLKYFSILLFSFIVLSICNTLTYYILDKQTLILQTSHAIVLIVSVSIIGTSIILFILVNTFAKIG
jgi:hypothetical protein